MAHDGVVADGGRLTDWISLGVLASSVPRDAVDATVAAAGKGAKRSDGNGLSLPYSSGPVEGNINRLKMLKRQMFGRASLDLLRKRVLLIR